VFKVRVFCSVLRHLSVLALLGAGTAYAQPGGCVLLHGGCGSPVQPQQCFPDALGPASWTDPGGARTSQVRFAAQSLQSTCHGPVGIGAPPACCTSLHPPAAPAPTLKLRVEGKRIWVDYEVPNYYCQNTGDWPPFFTCTNDPLTSSDHLFLFRGSSELISRAFIYYEKGSWDTGVDISCGETQPFTAFLSYTSASGPVATQVAQDLAAACTDRRSCSAGTGGPGAAVGAPVNVGSGDVSLSVSLFTVAQSPLALSFSLTYHSETPLYPALVSSPLGLGWTHPYAQTLRPTDPAGTFLYHLTATGLESLYRRQDDGSWTAASPGELRGQVVLNGSRYLLTDLDGTATSFDAATGQWLGTQDRWGNALAGSYDGSGHLDAVTDSEGRQITLTYNGGLLTSVTLPDGSLWRFGFSGEELGAVFDPLHTASTPWRTFAYQPDGQGAVRLLTAMRDEAGALLEGHDYDAKDRGTTSVSQGGRDLVTLQYDTPSPGQTTVTHRIDGGTSQVSVFTLTYGVGRYLATRILGNCATCAGASSDDQSFTYSADNHALSRTDANGHVTLYGYNADGNLTSLTEAAGAAEERTSLFRYEYAPWPNFQTAIDEPSAAKPGARKVTTKTWDSSAGLETKLTVAESGYLSPSDTAPTVYTRSETYDARHRLTASDGPRTDVVDVTTIYSYFADSDADPNRRGRLRQVTDPVGLTTLYDSYDLFGTPRQTTDANGVVTTRTTDARGRTVTSTLKAVAGDPNETVDYVTTHAWDGRDRLAQTTLPRGNVTVYGYEDGTNRLTDTVRLDASGNQAERRHLTLNDIGGTEREEDQSCDAPAASCTAWTARRSESFVYDVHNRLAQTVHPVPAGSKVTNTYDADGLLAAVQDEEHAAPNTRYDYDALHRVTVIRQTLAGAPGGAAVTRYGYDVRDNLSSVTDPNGNRTVYSYDDFHRLARQDSPVTGVTAYQYDPAGNLTSTTDARGAVTARTYDAANRVLMVTSTLAGTATETVTYTYDDTTAAHYGRGRVARMTDPSGSTSYTYDRRGLLKSEARTILGAAYATGYQYDANGNRTGITYPSGRQVTYGYDFADRPVTAAAGSTPLVTGVSYLPFGPEARTAFGNGTVRTTSFDLRYRPQENRLDGTAGPLADYLYQEDGVGNITALRDALDPGYDRLFGYDDLHRLTGASTGERLWGAGSYSYDPMGNMKTLSLGTARTAAFSYAGTLPELAAVQEGASSRAVTYDAAGNEAAVGGSVYTYSARNLLAAGDGLTYTYDGRGVRAAVTVAAAFGTINGTVVSSLDGTPISGATVRITGTGNATATDASGAFSLTAPAGIYTLTAGKPGFLDTASFPFTLPVGTDVTVGTLRLDPAPGTITGTVLSSLDGAPLAGVSVTVPETGDATVTGADGKLRLAEPAGTYSLALSAAGYGDQTVPAFALAAGTTKDIGTLTLIASPATLTGRVVDSTTGAGLAGATVTATAAGSAAAVRAAAASFSAITDAAGAFTLQIPAGTYTVTIAKAGYGPRTTAPLSLGPGTAQALGDQLLDALASIHGLVVRAADGAPVAGATVSVTGTLNTATTDAAGAFTLSQPAGTWTLTADAAGLATLTTAPFTLAPGASYDAGTLRLQPVALSVYVAYADNLRATAAFPNPWAGSPNVVFLGGGPVYDAGALRFDNGTDAPIAVDRVSVDLQRPGPVFSPWGSFTVPAHGSVILTQSGLFDFDTSDFPIVGCGGTLPPHDPRVPKVTVTVGGVATDYFDTGHILDTGGYDLACPGNESLPWRLIGTTGVSATGDFSLTPSAGQASFGTPYTLTATVTDANNQPQPNVTVTFQATAGPNSGPAGKSGQAVTDAQGHASFTYSSTYAATDTWQATIANASGGSLKSNAATVVWPAFAPFEVFVAYADTNRTNGKVPTPWAGDPGVLFLGRSTPYEAGAIRLDNPTDARIPIDKITVDLQRPRLAGPVFDLWPSFVIPPHGSAIITQTATNGLDSNFDTSDYPIVDPCQTASPTDPRIPKINVTIAGKTQSFLDTGHILDTFGEDLYWCIGNESLPWRPIGRSGDASADSHLALAPATAASPVGGQVTALAVAIDAAGEPETGVTIRFTVLSGPNAGRTATALTDSKGTAVFQYTGATAGTDTLQATITNASGGTVSSNTATVRWLPKVTLALSPPAASNPVGTPANLTLRAVDGTGQPVASLTVTFRVVSGPDAGRTGQGTTDTTGQALFTLTSSTSGTDTLEASLILQGGGAQASNQATVTWTTPQTLTLAPPAATLPVGAQATLTARLLDGARQPVAGAPVTVSVLSGPNAGSSGQTTTDAAGQAVFTYTGTAQGTDILQASTSAQRSNLVTATWTAVPTLVTFTGARTGTPGAPLQLAARLTESLTGAPLAGQTLTFILGTQTATATTGPDGVATATVTPAGPAGAVPLTVTFAGSGPYTGSSAALLIALQRIPTTLVYTGRPAVANGLPQTVIARLTDARTGQPLPGQTVTFTVGTLAASGATDTTGTASATLTLPATTGLAALKAVFAGDAAHLPSSTTARLLIYQPSSFVIWGGNTAGLLLGQRVNFWGAQWKSQVTGGDYAAQADFKGYGTTSGAITLCEPTARTTGTPRLDQSCWTSKPGNSNPPATLGDFIQVIVATSIAKQGSTIYGNIAATVVVQVDRTAPYAPDPGHPGYGTVVAVIEDGGGVFTQPATTSSAAMTADATASASVPLAVATGNHRYSIYSPELHLIAETELSTAARPAALTEYVWFDGHPIAQIDSVGVPSWTFTDHLGTPILQTSSTQGVTWRAEYEPYGEVYALRSYDRHQPLRLPGQEAEQLGLGANGVTERSYNVFRWYRSEWGRYSQADPIGLKGGIDLFGYAHSEPTTDTDLLGLCASGKCADCPGGFWVSTAGLVEGAFGYKALEAGGFLFAGVFICTSNPTFNVPWVTLCSGGWGGKDQVTKGFFGELNKWKWAKGGFAGGVGGAGVACAGFYCKEDLASGVEWGGFFQGGPMFVFGEHSADGFCGGIGAGPDVGMYAGGFGCKTFIGNSVRFTMDWLHLEKWLP
jgi:RHS repeat-associated protein